MKKVVILSGIPGSGKTTYSKILKPSCVVSVDLFFETPSGYEFDPNKLPQAHQMCFQEAIDWLNGYTQGVLVVDNTNTSAWEISPYVLAGETYGAVVEVHRLHVSVDVALKRNIHEVPERAIKEMAARFGKRDVLPWWKVIDVEMGRKTHA